MAKGREQEALQFFIDYHGNGDPTDELVLFEFAQMKETIQLEQEVRSEKWSNIIKSRGSMHRLGLAGLMSFLTAVSPFGFLSVIGVCLQQRLTSSNVSDVWM